MAQQGMEELPESLRMEILSRLPVKSVLRFRCVCKHWNSTFRTSYFITKHYSNSSLNNNNLNLFRLNLGITKSDLTYFSALSTEKGHNFKIKENIYLPFFLENNVGYTRVYGPCNGLFCLSNFDLVGIWNPSTREFRTIPKSTVCPPHRYQFSETRALGFGFDSTTHDHYKVLRFVKSQFKGWGKLKHQVELYSSRSDSWKEIPDFGLTPVGGCVGALEGYFVNGFYYWGALENSNYLLLSFDMTNETFSTLPFPISISGIYTGYLQFFQPPDGLLGVILCPKPMPNPKAKLRPKGKKEEAIMPTMCCVDFWVMTRKGLWTKQSRIELIPQVDPLGFWNNYDEIFLQNSNRQILHFDATTKETKNLYIDVSRHLMYFIPYVESLVPINGRSEPEENILRNTQCSCSYLEYTSKLWGLFKRKRQA